MVVLYILSTNPKTNESDDEGRSVQITKSSIEKLIKNIKINKTDENIKINKTDENIKINKTDENIKINKTNENIKINKTDESEIEGKSIKITKSSIEKLIKNIKIKNSKHPYNKNNTNLILKNDKSFYNSKKIALYKTEMCKSFTEIGYCKYEENCQFCHYPSELRKVKRHPKYKTEICRTFWLEGNCPYGNRCCFAHQENVKMTEKQKQQLDELYKANKNEKQALMDEFNNLKITPFVMKMNEINCNSYNKSNNNYNTKQIDEIKYKDDYNDDYKKNYTYREIDEIKYNDNYNIRQTDVIKYNDNYNIRQTDEIKYNDNYNIRQIDEIKYNDNYNIRQIDEIKYNDNYNIRQTDEIKYNDKENTFVKKINEIIANSFNTNTEKDEKTIKDIKSEIFPYIKAYNNPNQRPKLKKNLTINLLTREDLSPNSIFIDLIPSREEIEKYGEYQMGSLILNPYTKYGTSFKPIFSNKEKNENFSMILNDKIWNDDI